MNIAKRTSNLNIPIQSVKHRRLKCICMYRGMTQAELVSALIEGAWESLIRDPGFQQFMGGVSNHASK